MFDGSLPEIGELAALDDAAVVDAAGGWARVEAAACARKQAALGETFARRTGLGAEERELWWIDPDAAVTAELAAALNVSQGIALHQTHRGVALRDRLPQVAELFAAGLISDLLVRAIVWGTYLITDPEVMAKVDAALAEHVLAWGPLSVNKTEQAIDALIEQFDPGALRRARSAMRHRDVSFGAPDDQAGCTSMWARLLSGDAKVVAHRVEQIAASVCEHDPRTLGERRSDALTALAAGHTSLACGCGSTDCQAAGRGATAPISTVIHVVADTDTVTTARQQPGPDPDTPTPDEPDSHQPPPDSAPATDEPVADTGPAPGEPVADTGPAPGEPVADTGPAADEAPADIVPAPGEPVADTGPAADEAPADFVPAAKQPPARASSALADPCTGAPAFVIGGGIMPAALLAEVLTRATVREVRHPGIDAAPEAHYRPSPKLSEFVRCRDLTCRWPGCDKPADVCDLDHTVPYPLGPTHASNIKCLCRFHHLMKTFWGWLDRQLPDGTVIWTAPAGHTYTTYPGSKQLFPSLCRPTGTLWTDEPPRADATGDRGAMMPKRRHTRAYNQARAIAAERRLNNDLLAERSRPPPF